MRILVADDDRISQAVLTRALERLGHECETVDDGAAALAAWRERPFAIVISDWMMPGLDGPELCRRIRAQEPPGGLAYSYFILATSLESREHFLAGMEAGADDYLTKPLDRDQLRARLLAAERILTLHQRLAEQAARLERLNRQLFEEGRLDSLTRVGNRLRMTEDLAALHDRIVRYGHRSCVALCDIDFFKKYNDTCGHRAGDQALRAVAECLDSQVRTGDSVYRYGGEEFLIILSEQSLEGGAIAMERLRAAVEALGLDHPGKSPAGLVTISAGLAYLGPDDPKSIEELLQQADAALYQAKAAGRNQVACHASPT